MRNNVLKILVIFFLYSIFLTLPVMGKEEGKRVGKPPIEIGSLPSVPLNAEKLELNTGEPSVAGQATGRAFISNTPERMAISNDVLKYHVQGEFIKDTYEKLGESRVTSPVDPGFLPKRFSLSEQFPSTESDFSPNASDSAIVQWEAIKNTGWAPPDTVMAVGPNHVVQAVNSGFAVYSKTGAEIQGYTRFNNFMPKPPEFQGSMFDPRVIYDPDRERFLMLVIGKDDLKATSYFWIAISSTSDPADGWCHWWWNVTDTSGSSTAWVDYATLGTDQWGVYVTGNFFYFSGGYRGAYLQTISADIFSSDCAGDTHGWTWKNLKWPSGAKAFTLQPAQAHSINENEQTFFVNSHSGGGNSVLLWKLSGDRMDSPVLSKTTISTPVYHSIGGSVGQKGTSKKIEGGDARIMNAVYSNKRVFYTQTTDVFNDGDQAGWLTVKLNTATNSKDWDTLLWSEDNYYFYPALTLNGAGENNALAVFGSWSSADQYASGIVKIYEDQPNSPDGQFDKFKSGKSSYYRPSGGRNRWGDYSGASYDWACGFAWGAVETTGENKRWNTVITAKAFNNSDDLSCLESIRYKLTINKSGSGGGIIVSDPAGIDCNEECSKYFSSGQSVTLTAIADSTSRFVGWEGEPCNESETDSCAITIEDNLTVTALFESVCTQDGIEPDSSSYFGKVNEAENEIVGEYTLLLNTERCKYKLGDANGDGTIDILDIVQSINIVLIEGDSVFGADCHEDGNINIQDIVCTINKVLNL